ncbi:hypothetical protein, partial [Cyclobacterium sp.]|uniref:hypothetical protein n=1 Tax=Cyclobacterium sp. TaxID=1966343 RepID=UPI001988A80B
KMLPKKSPPDFGRDRLCPLKRGICQFTEDGSKIDFYKVLLVKKFKKKKNYILYTQSALARQKTGGAAGLWGEGFFCLDFLLLFDQAKSTIETS